MKRAAWDTEANGFVKEATTLHSLVLRDLDNPEKVLSGVQREHLQKAPPGESYCLIDDCLEILHNCEYSSAHNGLRYDLPLLKKLYPGFTLKGQLHDTLVTSFLIYPGVRMGNYDRGLLAKGRNIYFPPKFIGAHTLKAWGLRLGYHKGDYGEDAEDEEDIWAEWNPEMQTYCVQDTNVQFHVEAYLWSKVQRLGFSRESVWFEREVGSSITRQEARGVGFNLPGAEEAHGTLVDERDKLESQLSGLFPNWFAKDGKEGSFKRAMKRWKACPHGAHERPIKVKRISPKTGKLRLVNGDEMERGYYETVEEGATWQPIKEVMYNPTSRHHNLHWFKRKYGWVPTETTDKGNAKLDESVLSQLPFPEAQPVSTMFGLQKIIGYLHKGKHSWISSVDPETGRIYGRVKSNGALTGRMTHSQPNLAQVPASDNPWGPLCRALFIPRAGWLLVGCDASGLELRTLAHFLAKFDDGEYARQVLASDDEAVKAAGNDIHSINARRLGLDPKAKYDVAGKMIAGRNIAKTFFYALIYGSGDENLGWVMGVRGILEEVGDRVVDKKARKAGKHYRAIFMKEFPALAELTAKVKGILKKKKSLPGLDGRRLYPKGPHSALNTVNQNAGAMVMKKARLLTEAHLAGEGLVEDVDWGIVLDIHDEHQSECKPEYAELIGITKRKSIIEAGEYFDLRCPLEAEFKIGPTWAQTH